MSTAEEEVSALAIDIALISKACQELSQRQPIDAPTLDHGRYFAIAGDLWQKDVNHCQAVAVLLANSFFDSAIVVNRAVYETTINLVYLVTVGDKLSNAPLFEIRTVLEVIDHLPDQVGTGRRLLDEAPRQLVEIALGAKRSRKAWSGKTLAEMAEEIKVVGHKAAYAVQSWAAHARMAGQRIDRQPQSDETVRWTFGSSGGDPKEIWAIANHTRRMLHCCYVLIAEDFFGQVVKLQTTNPFEANVHGCDLPNA